MHGTAFFGRGVNNFLSFLPAKVARGKGGKGGKGGQGGNEQAPLLGQGGAKAAAAERSAGWRRARRRRRNEASIAPLPEFPGAAATAGDDQRRGRAGCAAFSRR